MHALSVFKKNIELFIELFEYNFSAKDKLNICFNLNFDNIV